MKLPDDFTPWDGKRRFFGTRRLQVIFRNGRVSKDILPAEKWNGVHRPGGDHPYDIIAVRVAE